jgi:hypothetical protein
MLRIFEGAISIDSLKEFSYKDACKFLDDVTEIVKLKKEEHNKIKNQRDVKKLSN